MTITINISLPGDGDDYELRLDKIKKTPAESRAEWTDLETTVQYLKRRTPAALEILRALAAGQKPTTTDLVDIAGLEDTSQVAGALSWPGRDAYDWGLKLPWVWNGTVLDMDEPTQAMFRRAFEEIN